MFIIISGKRENFISKIKREMLYYSRICIRVFGIIVMGIIFINFY